MTSAGILPADDALRARSRVPALSSQRTVGAVEVSTLLLMGASAAALTTFVRFKLGIPGHHVAFSAFPMALGFALVPRRRAGTVMGGGAAGAVALFGAAGANVPGIGALTSLLLMGPLLDIALRLGRDGRRLHLAFMAAGVVGNLVALVLRGAVKMAAVPGLAGTRPFASWAPEAVLTYAAAGLVAGSLSAFTWFRLHERVRRG